MSQTAPLHSPLRNTVPSRTRTGGSGTENERLRSSLWVRPLDLAACWARLGTQQEGRLRVRTGAGDRAVVTGYQAYVEGSLVGVVIAVPEFNNLFQYAVRRSVTLEVSGRDADGGHWTVLLSGVAHELEPGRHGQPAHPEWPDGVARRHLYLPATHLKGSVAHPCGVANGTRVDGPPDEQ